MIECFLKTLLTFRTYLADVQINRKKIDADYDSLLLPSFYYRYRRCLTKNNGTIDCKFFKKKLYLIMNNFCAQIVSISFHSF